MGYKGQVELKSTEVKRQTITSSTSATHTLNWTPPNEQSLLITINGVGQHDSAYTVSGTTLTLASALVATDELEITGIQDAGKTIIPAAGSVIDSHISSSAAIATSKITGLATSATTDTTNAANISSGTLATARLGSTIDLSAATVTLPAASVTAHATDYDDNDLKNDIALLGFRVASNGALAKYDLSNQIIDDFQSDAGVDTTNSTGEKRDTTGKYYSSSGPGTETLLTRGGTAPDGIADSMVSLSGFTNYSISVLNDDATGGSALLADGVAAGAYIQIDFGAGNEKGVTKWGIFYQNTNIRCLFSKTQWSTDASTWTDITFTTNIGGSPNTVAGHNFSNSFASPGEKRYWRLVKTDPAVNGSWMSCMSVYHTPDSIGSDMTLISNATTAVDGAPTKGDLIFTYSDGVGTNVVGTDIKAYISRDGTNYTGPITMTNEGTTGGHTILAAHDVALTSTAGTSMKWKITTENQSASKEARIHAVSLGWS